MRALAQTEQPRAAGAAPINEGGGLAFLGKRRARARVGTCGGLRRGGWVVFFLPSLGACSRRPVYSAGTASISLTRPAARSSDNFEPVPRRYRRALPDSATTSTLVCQLRVIEAQRHQKASKPHARNHIAPRTPSPSCDPQSHVHQMHGIKCRNIPITHETKMEPTSSCKTTPPIEILSMVQLFIRENSRLRAGKHENDLESTKRGRNSQSAPDASGDLVRDSPYDVSDAIRFPCISFKGLNLLRSSTYSIPIGRKDIKYLTLTKDTTGSRVLSRRRPHTIYI